MDWLAANSQKVINSIRAIVVLGVGFDAIEITEEQLALLIAAMETVFATITAKTTISAANVDTIVERRMSDVMTPPPVLP
jgi:hypothetical protein